MALDGDPWFVAADVCRVLGAYVYGGKVNVTDATRKLEADEVLVAGVDRINPWTFDRRAKMVVLVSEPGLYRLIMRSDKPIARPFQDWITREVIPAIRKTGGYVLAGADRASVQEGATEVLPLPTTFTDALRQHAATLIKLAEEQEAHAKTQAERDAALSGMAVRMPDAACIVPTPSSSDLFVIPVQQREYRGERQGYSNQLLRSFGHGRGHTSLANSVPAAEPDFGPSTSDEACRLTWVHQYETSR